MLFRLQHLKSQLFENFKAHLFVKMLLFYTCVFLVPFLICSSFLSQYVMAGYKEDVLELNSKAINYIRRMIDENLVDMDAVALQVAENEEIMDFLQHTEMTEQEKPYYVWQAVKIIDEYCAYKSCIKEIHLYAANTDCIVTPGGGYTKSEYFSKYLYTSGISGREWEDYLDNPRTNSTPIISKYSDSGGTTGVIIRHGVRDRNGNIPTLMVVLDADSIMATYAELVTSGSPSYFAVTSDRNILIQSGKAPITFQPSELSQTESSVEETDDGYVLFSSKSQNQRLNYVCIMAEDDILQEVQHINLVLMVILVLMALALILLSLVFSNQTYKPIKSIARFGNRDKSYNFDSVNEFQEYLVNIIHSNTQLNETVSRQQEYINRNIFKNFIQNSATADTEMLSVMFEETAVTLKERYFRAAVVEFGELSYNNIDRFNLVTGFQDILKEYRIKHTILPDENSGIIMLLAYDKGDEHIREVFEKVASHLEKNYNIDAAISLGRSVIEIEKFSKSYEDAILAMEQRTKKVTVYDRDTGLSYQQYFNFVKKDKLIYDLRQGDTVAVQSLMNRVEERTFSKRTTTLGIQHYIRRLLVGILDEALGEEKDMRMKKCLKECDETLHNQNLKEALEQIGKCYAEATRCVLESRNKQGGDTIEEIVRYVNEHYADPDISLKQIAEELGISYKRVSEEFQKKTGTKFIDYLHSVRNEEAKRLLLTTDRKVLEISEQVGYMGANAFVKNFKKLNGITPGKFRQSGK